MSFFLIAWFLREVKEEDEQESGNVPNSNRAEWEKLSSLMSSTLLFHRDLWLCAETYDVLHLMQTHTHTYTHIQSHTSVLPCPRNLQTCFLAGTDL